jgi:hypothetical protein
MKSVPLLIEVKATSTSEARPDAETALDALETELKTSGYQLVSDEHEPHDAVMLVELVMSKRNQPFVIMQNGKVVDGLHAQLSLTLRADDKPVHSVRREFHFTQGEVAASLREVQAVVHELNGAPVVRELGDKLAKARGEREAAEAKMERAEWREKYADKCEKAEAPRACDELQRWLDRNEGKPQATSLAQEGKEILEVAKPKLAALGDDSLWLDARESECLERATESACRGVKTYLKQLPNGKHAGDAHAALDHLKNEAVGRANEREREKQAGEAARRNAAAAAADAARAEQERQAEQQACLAQCNANCAAMSDAAKKRACNGGCQERCQ